MLLDCQELELHYQIMKAAISLCCCVLGGKGGAGLVMFFSFFTKSSLSNQFLQTDV